MQEGPNTTQQGSGSLNTNIYTCGGSACRGPEPNTPCRADGIAMGDWDPCCGFIVLCDCWEVARWAETPS